MRAFLCEAFGPPETLKLQTIPDPKPTAQEVVVRVAVCSANFPDTLMIQNKYQIKPPLPFAPGGEVAGVIEQVGDDVSAWFPGQKVIALCGWGGMAEKVVVSQDKVLPLPEGMDFITGASLLYTFGTAYHALQDRARILPGETLLVLGAAGGVGLAAIQLGKFLGARVIAVASTEEKRNLCQHYGADLCLPYDPPLWKESIGKQGVDVILDPVGGQWTEPAVRLLAWQGRYLVVGFTDGKIGSPPLNLALLKGASWMGVFWGRFTQEQPEQSRQNGETLAHLFAQGYLKPHIHQSYSLANASEALIALQNRQVLGKAIVVINPELAQAPMSPVATPKILLFPTLAALDAHEGKSLGTTPWLTITQDRIDAFAHATNDRQWIHLDPKQASRTTFNGTIAHGFLTLSLISDWMFNLYQVECAQMSVNYGSDRIRFLHPVHTGNRLRASAILQKVDSVSPKVRRLHTRVTVEIEGLPKPACIADLISLVYE